MVMTFEEHKARAMMLGEGWEFNAKGYYYFEGNLMPQNRTRLDADTLEPITLEEAEARREDEYGSTKLPFPRRT
jgi:hypothetical protein